MIAHRTVFVLGAGASAPYGFPLGMQLVDRICADIIDNGDSGIRGRLHRLRFSGTLVTDFANTLRAARPYSVDAFLEMRPEFKQVGKAAIADVLLRAESQRLIDTVQSDVDWYRYLFNQVLLIRSIDHFRQQARQLTIITFNFDRSFERALYSRLRACFELSEAGAREEAAELCIHHIHGKLGEPDWLFPDSELSTTYGPTGDELVPAVERSIQSIRIVDEEVLDSQPLGAARAALGRAKYVYFIGFGFDSRNLFKLGTPGSLGTATVRGTILNWATSELGPVTRHFTVDGGCQIHTYADDAISFLRRRAEALFD